MIDKYLQREIVLDKKEPKEIKFIEDPYSFDKCERCEKKTTEIIMSVFNTQMICLECSEKENENKIHKEKKGNRNY
ncbi:hypothetical protein LCGC14_0604640 [marine sediment metagenome]|uniref:Uncharacterized protein n=1 Tax=marine sediment metagenome TaxID=412755 RepID=A0A0F9RTI2_9ZZZZ|nr:MAG: hypothetical protein Lokiarch_19880 [Candidatus Lokiarchaeum sp. GC14_75]HEA70439.1 hypothetical protein [archaeon]